MKRKTILAFAIGPILAAAFAFIALPIIAWMFTPEDVGRLNVLQTLISFTLLFFILGLDQAYVREYHESNNKFRLFKACLLPGMYLLIFVVVITLPFASELSKWLYGMDEPKWHWISLGCVLACFLSRFLSLIVRMQERGLAYSISQVIPKIAVLIVLMGYIIFDTPRNYTYLLATQLVSFTLVVFIFGWTSRLDWVPAINARLNGQEMRKLLRFGGPLIGAGMAVWGLTATSTVALRTYSGFRELGVYSMAVNFAGVAIIFQSIFSTVWMPTVYKWVAAGEDLSKIDRIRDQVLIVVCLIFAITGTFSWIIDFIIPEDYSKVKYIVVCCMVQPLFYTLSETTVVGLNIQRKSNHALMVAVAALLSNVVLSLLLVPSFGSTGAAIANALAFTVFFVARTEISAKLWRPIARFKMYVTLAVFVFLSITYAIFGDIIGIYFNIIWAALFIIYYLLNIRAIKNTYRELFV